MRNFLPRSAIALAVSLASATQFTPALAQGPALALEEVLVTARRRSENLQDVPIAVTALSGQALRMRGAADISELAQLIPSVTLEPSRATSTTLTAFIRGVGQQDPLAGFEQGVALYLDDVYVARPQGALLDIYDVERVEVLRGPQGTLYGRNAVGGAIKYVTRRLSDEVDVRLKGSIGSYNQRDLVATASTPLGDGFRLGGTVARLTRDGYGDNLTTGEEHYDKDLFAYRVSAEWLPSEDWLIRLAYDNSDDKSNPVAGYRPFPGAVSGVPVLDDVHDTTAGASERPSTAGINGNNQVEAEGLMLSVDWDPTDAITLRSITAYREDYTESVIDFDGLAVMDFDAPVIYDNEQFSQELQLLYNADRWNAVVGFYYLDATAANDFDVVLGQIGPVTAYTGGTVDTEAWSVFADVTYQLTGQLSLSLGGRYTEDKRDADIFRANYLGLGSPFLGNDSALLLAVTSDYEASKTYTDFSPRVNLSYALGEDATVYLGYSRGWKAGSFDPRGANFVTPEVERGFDAETLDSYEAGLKMAWLEGRAVTNIAVFYSDYQDMQIPGSVGVDSDGDGVNDGFVGTVTNAGKAEISGVELEGSVLLTERLSAQLALSFLDAEIKEWLFNGVDVSDQRAVQNTPEEMAYIGLTYTMGLAAGDISFSANWSYKGDVTQFEAPVPVIDQDSHDVFNASVVWLSSDDSWLLGIHGKNLADEEIKTAGYCFGSGGCPSQLGLEDNTTVFYAPPRTVTATVEYRF
ncbi:TonB-dependent receptor [Kineobactrum salinum]|uniref:TonB-dependent receptor n=1 Tax=Kineobactrum salinum TaxID=2708301 RepID=A0A6C0U037_9GAMM|nr:TonB-dependent receptor [Kineobactrum salinum]QIB65460.1 TonB-dependent receptor [Kineobactrum salinum]